MNSQNKFTKNDVIEEIIKCGKDPIHFICTYAKIQHPVKGILPFELYPYQKDIIYAYLKYRKNILLKARQLGMTTTTAAYIAWLILFHRDKNVLIVATKQETSKNMIRIVRNIFKYLPRWLTDVGKIKIDNRHSLELENGSRVKAVTTSIDVGRSEAVSFLVVDEVAFIPTFDDIWTGLSPTVSTGGCIALMSSPCGTGNAFHRIFENAKNEEDGLGFNCRFGTYVNPNDPTEVYNDRFMWWVHPEHDQAWFDNEIKDKSPREINQEMNCCFNASGDTFIFHEDISRIQSRVKEPKNKFHINRDVWIWEDSDKNGSYLISCLPEGEKVLTNSGLKNVKNIEPMDSLVDISGKEVTVKNKQITTNWIGKIYEFKLSNNFRSFKFTNNHPIWCSSAILKRNYLKNHNTYRFNERYWDLDFSFKKSEDVCVGDWIEFPNIYRNKILTSEQILSYWKPSDTRTDFKLNNNILLSKDFWWFIGMWLAEGWVINSYDNVYQIETAHNIKEKDIIFKMKNIINNLFDRQANLIEKKEDNCIKISFSSKELGIFLTSEFGKYAHGKKIPQWVKYLPDNLKMNLIEGYILGDGCWFSEERVNKNIVDLESKMSCVSVSLELLEGIQDILFSVGIMSCLGKLRDEKKTFIKKRESKQKITYSLSLSHYDSVDLANRLKWNHSYEIKNKRIIKDSFFSKDLSKIYFRVKKIIKKEYSGNVYNFETETHTYCTNRIVTHNCDVSRGDAKDYSAFHVFRMDTHPIRQVAEYKGKIKPDQLGLLLVSVGQVYNNATIAPENNSGWSGQAILKIEECRYPFLYFSRRRKPKEKEYTPVDPYYAMNRNDYLPGYSVTSANRSQMLAKMEQYVRMGDVEINSPRLLEEFKTFIVTETNRAEAMRGYNDDLIMALAGGLWVRDEAFLYSYRNDEIAKSMLDGMSTSKTPITQYSDFNHNTNFFDRGRIIEHVNDQNKIKLGDGSEESLLWLIKG